MLTMPLGARGDNRQMLIVIDISKIIRTWGPGRFAFRRLQADGEISPPHMLYRVNLNHVLDKNGSLIFFEPTTNETSRSAVRPNSQLAFYPDESKDKHGVVLSDVFTSTIPHYDDETDTPGELDWLDKWENDPEKMEIIRQLAEWNEAHRSD